MPIQKSLKLKLYSLKSVFVSIGKKSIYALGVAALIGGLAFGANALLNGKSIEIQAFQAVLDCQYSGYAKNSSVNCKYSEEQAYRLANEYSWGFSGIDECVPYYGKSSCYLDYQKNVAIRPSGFALLNGKDSLPLFYSPSLGSHVLPSGYPVQMGANLVASPSGMDPGILKEPLSLSNSGCSKESADSMNCQSLFERIKNIEPGSSKHFIREIMSIVP